MTGQAYFIKSKFNGRVLDVQGGSTHDGAEVIVYQQKHQDNRNQLWYYQDGYFVNVLSAKVLDIKGGEMKVGSAIIQYAQKVTSEAANQRWEIDGQGYIFCSARPDLVLDIQGAQDDDNVPVILYQKREGQAASNQQWELEPFFH